MPLVEFELTIPVFEWAAAIVTGIAITNHTIFYITSPSG
jgi:hypothetical protein